MVIDFKKYLNQYTEATTLAFFRLTFGFMMVFSIIRFASYGWIDSLYIKPLLHFTYYGFEWVKPIGIYTYWIFAICGLAALFVALGYKYRISIVVFFLSFTYIELMDKTTYLNHYYFISIVSFVMIFLPANAYFSIDAYRNPKIAFQQIPQWTTDILKVLIGIVYFYAGLAKINSDWLLHAMPLKMWLPGNSNLPIIGALLKQTWIHYVFSWFGMFYDLLIPFLLLNKKTRNIAFFFVVVFHVLTRILFPIGIFPYVMIVCSLLFFDSSFHYKIIQWISNALKINSTIFDNGKTKIQEFVFYYKAKLVVLGSFLLFQLLFPFRYLLYPNELFWTEEGYRFSWRVMLMEKNGYINFIVTDVETKQKIRVNNRDFLTSFQEKQMAFQPDFILEYAHYLRNYYSNRGFHNPEVRVESFISMNGRLSQPYIDPNKNLIEENESFKHKTWILPFNDSIKGF